MIDSQAPYSADSSQMSSMRHSLGAPPRPLAGLEPGEPVSSSYVRSILTRLGERAGLSKRIHAHGLRRTHASELVAEGAPLTTVQAQLGHAAASTTSVYLGEIGTARKDLIAARLTKAQREEQAVEAGRDELVTISRVELDRLVSDAVTNAMRMRRR